MNTVLRPLQARDPEVALAELRARLQEAEDTLAAIRSGGVDAIVVDGPEGEKVFSLAGAERPYRLMIERMNQGAAMLRDDGTIIFCNAALAAMLGSTPEGVTGSDIRAHVPLDMCEKLEPVLEEGGRSGSRQELRLRSSGGAEVPALLAVSNLGPESSATLCLLATDLTEQRRREEQLESSHRAASAYADALRRSNEELQDFASVAGHDLQQPVRKVCLLAGQLQESWGEQLGEQGRNVVERLFASAERMHRLVDALLSYARVGSKPDPLVAVSLDRVLGAVIADLEIAIQEAGARVEVAHLPEVIGDETQLRQLFQNLISNALKYCRQDAPPEIAIETHPESANMLEIRVRDNGSGFDMAQAEAIFRPFRRLVSEAECPGTGMGLAICRKIAARHGGSISAQSQPGVGSTFLVRLPISLH